MLEDDPTDGIPWSGPGYYHFNTPGNDRIVSKRVTSRYKSGRCLNWLKVKNPAYDRRAGA